jgi:uronate dehydrogenase
MFGVMSRLLRRRGPAWPSVLVTGGAGRIGTVLRRGWKGPLTAFDLPDGDARDRAALIRAAAGHDAIVHLAAVLERENHINNEFWPDNQVMTVNALEAAVAAGVPRVVLASSVHTDRWWPPAADGRLLDPTHEPVPTSPYGASKVFMEALGRHFAAARGVEVVAVRFGGVNPRDRRPDDPLERAAWLPHADCLALVHAAVADPLPAGRRYALVVGVGDGPHRVHDYGPDPLWRPGRA